MVELFHGDFGMESCVGVKTLVGCAQLVEEGQALFPTEQLIL